MKENAYNIQNDKLPYIYLLFISHLKNIKFPVNLNMTPVVSPIVIGAQLTISQLS